MSGVTGAGAGAIALPAAGSSGAADVSGVTGAGADAGATGVGAGAGAIALPATGPAGTAGTAGVGAIALPASGPMGMAGTAGAVVPGSAGAGAAGAGVAAATGAGVAAAAAGAGAAGAGAAGAGAEAGAGAYVGAGVATAIGAATGAKIDSDSGSAADGWWGRCAIRPGAVAPLVTVPSETARIAAWWLRRRRVSARATTSSTVDLRPLRRSYERPARWCPAMPPRTDCLVVPGSGRGLCRGCRNGRGGHRRQSQGHDRSSFRVPRVQSAAFVDATTLTLAHRSASWNCDGALHPRLCFCQLPAGVAGAAYRRPRLSDPAVLTRRWLWKGDSGFPTTPEPKTKTFGSSPDVHNRLGRNSE